MSTLSSPLVETPLRTRVQQSSVDAYKQTQTKREAAHRNIVHVIKTAHLCGQVNLTAREVGKLYQDTFNDYLPPNEVSARINELMKQGLVVRDEKKRPCTVTGRNVLTVHCPMRQASLV